MLDRYKITFCSRINTKYVWDAYIPARSEEGAIKALEKIVDASTMRTPIKVLRIKQIGDR